MCGSTWTQEPAFDPAPARRQRALELAVQTKTVDGEGDVLALAREYDDFLAGKAGGE